MFARCSSVLLLTVACSTEASKADSADSGSSTPVLDDTTLAAQLWEHLQGYQAWGRPAGWSDAPVLSGNHMGAYVIRYDDPDLAAWDGTGDAPAGSLSVKEEYADQAGVTLNDLTVMWKVPGYAPDDGDWFWAVFSPDGTAMMAGAIAMCADCHGTTGVDYLHTEPPAAP